jgi:hypothetical protein
MIARFAGVLVATLVVLAGAQRAALADCRTFVDNRGGHLGYVVRQKEPVELYAYVGLPNNARDESPRDFEWNIDQSGAAVVKDVPPGAGHATFYPGLQRKLYRRVTVTAIRTSGERCTPTTLQIAVDLDYEQFIVVDQWTGSAHDELTPGTSLRSPSGEIRATMEFSQLSLPMYVSASASRLTYSHPANALSGACPAPDPGCVTGVAPDFYGPRGLGQQYIGARTISESVVDVRFGLKVIDPRIYLGVAYVNRAWNAPGHGNLRGSAFVIEKLPDLDQRVTLLGSFAYAPSASGVWTGPDGRRFNVTYTYARYRVGGALVLFAGRPWFVEGGVAEDRGTARVNAPADFTRSETFIGLGARF